MMVLKSEELFCSMLAPKRLEILLLLREKPRSPKEFQKLLQPNHLALKILWDLCNVHLVCKKISSDACVYQLTALGEDYLKVLDQLIGWSESHLFYGGRI